MSALTFERIPARPNLECHRQPIRASLSQAFPALKGAVVKEMRRSIVPDAPNPPNNCPFSQRAQAVVDRTIQDPSIISTAPPIFPASTCVDPFAAKFSLRLYLAFCSCPPPSIAPLYQQASYGRSLRQSGHCLRD